MMTSEPVSVRAGDSLSWERSLPDFPASDGWTVAYRIISAATAVAITATGSGDTYNVSIPRATTAAWTAGEYQLVGTATKGTDRVTFHIGRFTVLPDLGAVSSLDPRSSAEVELAAARAAWERGVKSYTVGDRQMQFSDSADMLVRIRYLEQEVARERTDRAMAQLLQSGEGMPPGRVLYRG